MINLSDTSLAVYVLFSITIVPCTFYAFYTHKPKDLFSHFSKIILLAVTFILVLACPLSIPIIAVVLYYINRREFECGDSGKSSAVEHISPKSSTSSAEQKLSSYKVCRFIWVNAELFAKSAKLNQSIYSLTYIWTSLFYVVTKSIRSQPIVDEIYSQFEYAARDFFKDNVRGLEPYVIIRDTYRRFRIILNSSGIDPRSTDGLSALWNITCDIAYPDTKPGVHVSSSFASAARFVITYCSHYYPIKAVASMSSPSANVQHSVSDPGEFNLPLNE